MPPGPSLPLQMNEPIDLLVYLKLLSEHSKVPGSYKGQDRSGRESQPGWEWSSPEDARGWVLMGEHTAFHLPPAQALGPCTVLCSGCCSLEHLELASVLFHTLPSVLLGDISMLYLHLSLSLCWTLEATGVVRTSYV